MKFKKSMIALGILLVSVFAGTIPTFASEFSFAVTPVIPENQIDKTKTYFDLKMAPDQKEQVNVELRNDTDRNVKVDVTVNSATTNSNVIVEYGKNKIAPDKSLKYNLKDYVKAPNQVTINAHSTLQVPFDLTMPKEQFDGLMAGGITFKEAKDEKTTENTSEQKGLAIENEYSYVVALLMRQNTTKVTPQMALNTVKPSQLNARNVIVSNLQNSKATYINQVAIDAEITKKGDSTVLYSEHHDGLQIAPNSQFDFPVHLNGKPLEAGKYHIKLVVNGDKNAEGQYIRGKDKDNQAEHYTNQWVFDKDFTIDGQVARKLNDKDVTIKKDYTWLYILIGILLLLLVLFIIWLIWRKKKKDEEDKENKAE
ncbi:DUF916 and DUF3324 domain-containing protein [Enterococcus pallens]|uniref:Uncharacterized protein n=1 Tax=Enterococcus pallens ATCC BAA-351 TaxID=1158607 RepID=R2SQK4_9ENTE|nr:DUF916 and DUF3324 domain-containing protein [Enterococcus pallens]EOH97515.1 hypothetical protein UAU_00183 [Enterococcus pallens ATCC BAA-351]EOU21066.1 hypothetical protein I588_01913 [Enterococcus pallens ATCC BAA-351]OJG77799.1 hypothetical protein RV10_GL002192 [Enterococcus pallens]